MFSQVIDYLGSWPIEVSSNFSGLQLLKKISVRCLEMACTESRLSEVYLRYLCLLHELWGSISVLLHLLDRSNFLMENALIIFFSSRNQQEK